MDEIDIEERPRHKYMTRTQLRVSMKRRPLSRSLSASDVGFAPSRVLKASSVYSQEPAKSKDVVQPIHRPSNKINRNSLSVLSQAQRRGFSIGSVVAEAAQMGQIDNELDLSRPATRSTLEPLQLGRLLTSNKHSSKQLKNAAPSDFGVASSSMRSFYSSCLPFRGGPCARVASPCIDREIGSQ